VGEVGGGVRLGEQVGELFDFESELERRGVVKAAAEDDAACGGVQCGSGFARLWLGRERAVQASGSISSSASRAASPARWAESIASAVSWAV
jgi:hypothetical protein